MDCSTGKCHNAKPYITVRAFQLDQSPKRRQKDQVKAEREPFDAASVVESPQVVRVPSREPREVKSMYHHLKSSFILEACGGPPLLMASWLNVSLIHHGNVVRKPKLGSFDYFRRQDRRTCEP